MQDLRWILEDLPVGVWVRDLPNGRLVYANRELRRIMGIDTVAESTIDDAATTYRIFDRAGNRYPVERLPFSLVGARQKPVLVDDMVIHRPDQQKVNVRCVGYPAFDSEKNLTHVVVAFLDITKEVKAEAEREQTEARLALAVNHAPIVVWAADRDGVVTVSEGAGLASLGVKSGELVGKNIFELYKDHPTISGHLRRGLGGESFWYTVQVGEAVYDTWLAPIRNANGEVAGVVALSNDVSEVRRLQANAIQNDRVIALGTLAASVAHEINNPLTYILGHVKMLGEALEKTGQVVTELKGAEGEVLRDIVARMRQMLEPIRHGTERIASITRDLRTFSRPGPDEAAIVDVRSVVESVLQLIGKELEARARLFLNLRDTAAVRGNQARFVQVILNLVVNAMQALPSDRREESEIGVSTRNDGSDVVIEVADSGPGVALADRERIFEPFFSTKEIGEGTGLGLFVCRNIVRGFSGDVTVGDRPGGGALFRVVIPAMSEASATVAVSERVDSVSTARLSGSVLVIEDEPLVAQMLCQQLLAAGYRANTEDDAERALDHLARDDANVDLVYCDLMMKGMTGMDLAEELETRNPAARAKMVFMTGGAFTPRARAFLDGNAGQVVEKPFDVVAETDRRLRLLRSRRTHP
jgi:PAS domain S-box-containing protein